MNLNILNIKSVLKVESGFYISILILVIIVILATFWTYQKFPPEFPMYYSLSYGESQLATKQDLIRISGSVIGISFLNIIISSTIFKRKTPTRLLLGVTSAWLVLYILSLVFITKLII